jgi:putative oxidoreductase
MKFLKKLPVPLLGVLFILFAIQFVIMLATNAQMPPMNPMAAQFMGVLFASGFVWIIKGIEFVAGVLMVIPRTRKIGLLLIAPIMVGILITETLIVVPPVGQAIPALVMFALTVTGFYQYRASFIKVLEK